MTTIVRCPCVHAGTGKIQKTPKEKGSLYLGKTSNADKALHGYNYTLLSWKCT